jgi:hypothetical protein
MLGPYFGDDEGTAAEGPYKRLLKLRKWLYLASAFAGLNAAGLLRPEKFSSLVAGLVHVTPFIATVAIVTGFTLTTVQYFVLLVQLGTTYDIVLEDRLAGRRREDIKIAKTELEKIAGEVAPLKEQEVLFEQEKVNITLSEPKTDELIFTTVTGKYLVEDMDADEFTFDLIGEPHRSKEYKAIEQAVIEAFRSYSTKARAEMMQTHIGNGPSTPLGQVVQKIRDYRAADIKLRLHRNSHASDYKRLAAAEAEYARVLRSDPAERPLFLPIERFLDRVRVWPPVGAAVIAWCHIGYAVWWGLNLKP